MPFANSIMSKLVAIDDKIKFYSVKSFNNKNIVKKYVKEFGLDKICKQINEDKIKSKVSSKDRNVNKKELRPFDPEYDDLARLHYLILSRKIINTLEFGSGYSTVIMADAHKILKHQFNSWVLENLRIKKPFHIYSIDESAKFSKIVQKRLGASITGFTLYIFTVYGAVYGYFLFNEQFEFYHLIGTILVFFGVFLAKRKNEKKN